MAIFTSRYLVWLLHLSALLFLSSSFSVLGNYHEAERFSTGVSFAQAPQYFHGMHPPVGAPSPQHHHHHHHHPHHPKHPLTPPPSRPPTPPTAKPPTSPPAKSPTHPPTKPPTHQPPAKPPTAKPPVPPRKLVAVQGVVYCKSCKYTGVDTLTAATPLANGTVRLTCANTKYHMVEEAHTDKNGYFIIMPRKGLTTAGSHKCKVSLLSPPPSSPCTSPTDFHSGRKGAILMPSPTSPPWPNPAKYQMFTVGPFAFEPPKKC